MFVCGSIVPPVYVQRSGSGSAPVDGINGVSTGVELVPSGRAPQIVVTT